MSLEEIGQIWSERELAGRFGLPINKETGRSRTVGSWVSKGLRCSVYISGRRFFFEGDVVFLDGGDVEALVNDFGEMLDLVAKRRQHADRITECHRTHGLRRPIDVLRHDSGSISVLSI